MPRAPGNSFTLVAAAATLWGLFFWIASVVPVTANYTAFERAAIALVCANVLAAFSPAVVIAVITETRSAGPLSQLCMSIVVLADLAMVITFSLNFSGSGTSGRSSFGNAFIFHSAVSDCNSFVT